MRTFSIPTQLVIGQDSLTALLGLQEQRICFVCDQFLVNSDAFKRIIEALTAHNEIDIFSDVTPDPCVDDVAKGVAKLAQFCPDTVVAYGGGSAIDLAKAVRFFARQAGIEISQFIAIPTTSGTGSEVTNISVISVPEKKLKLPLIDDALLPDIAILDPHQTLTVPAAVTANTGIDVLTHAIEAIVSVNADDFSNALAEKAITLVFKYLAQACKQGSDANARLKLHNASCLAGLAFNHAGLGLTHAIAHQLGAICHVPHGLANALLLTPVMQFNRRCSKTEADYARLARTLGFVSRDASYQEGADKLIAALNELIVQVGISESAKRLDINPSNNPQQLTMMAEKALQDMTLTTNPVQPTVQEVKRILGSIQR